MNHNLGGTSVLIVEDEVIIGLMLVKEIAAAGGNPVGPFTSAADALREIDHQIVDLVILDAKLVDGWGENIAACLEQRRIPFIVVSGYDETNLPKGLKKAPFVAKPISLPVLLEAIASVMPARTSAPTALEAH